MDLARELTKTHPGDDSEDLLIRARLARAGSLADAGLLRDALRLLDHLEVKHPRAREETRWLRLAIEVRSGRLDHILRELAAAEAEEDDARIARVHDILRREMRNPAIVAETPLLPPDHPLRKEAAAAARIFERLVSGPQAPNEDPPAAAVPRRSPFAPWVLAGRAIQAAYRKDVETLRRLERSLPASSPPSRILPLLKVMAGLAPPAGLDLAEGRVFDAVEGGRGSLSHRLRKLEKEIEEGEAGAAETSAFRLVREIRTRDPTLVPEFQRLLWEAWARSELPLEILDDVFTDTGCSESEMYRYSALTLERHGALYAALGAWDSFLEKAGTRLPPREIAMVRLRQARLAAALQEDLGAESDDPWEVIVDPLLFLDAAAEAFPCARTFEPLMDTLTARGRKEAEAVALRWHESDPRALAPLLHLLHSTERRGAIRKALKWIEKIEAVEPCHPEARGGRFRLLLAGATYRIRRAKFHLARRDIEDLRQTPRGADPEFQCLLDGLSWFAAEGETQRTATLRSMDADLGEHGTDLLLRQMERQLGAKRFVPRLPSRDGRPPPGRVIPILARLARVFIALDWTLFPPAAWKKALRAALESWTDPSVRDLDPLCRIMMNEGEWDILYLLSGKGLLHGGAQRYRFLFYRGQSFVELHEMDRRRSCLRAAQELARRAGDRETEAESRDGLFPDLPQIGVLMDFPAEEDETPLSREDLAHIIEFEANAPLKRRRPRRRRKKIRDIAELFDF